MASTETNQSDHKPSAYETNQSNREQWPLIIPGVYGSWVDHFPRLKYIFDIYVSTKNVYEAYGYNSLIPELDHKLVKYDERIHIYKAKRCLSTSRRVGDSLSRVPRCCPSRECCISSHYKLFRNYHFLCGCTIDRRVHHAEVNAF